MYSVNLLCGVRDRRSDRVDHSAGTARELVLFCAVQSGLRMFLENAIDSIIMQLQ